MEKHLGKVLSVEVHEGNGEPGTRYGDIRIAYPDINFSRDIPALLVTVFGKLSMDGRIKLMDLDFSESSNRHSQVPSSDWQASASCSALESARC